MPEKQLSCSRTCMAFTAVKLGSQIKTNAWHSSLNCGNTVEKVNRHQAIGTPMCFFDLMDGWDWNNGKRLLQMREGRMHLH